MNLTLSVDEQLVERAREAARLRGTSLNALIREYIEVLAGNQNGAQVLASFETLWADSGNSSGSSFDRDSIYERSDRYKPR
ncbi:hypothetical protein BH11MYX1_BH11MYX1_01160 [soil metagenome]